MANENLIFENASIQFRNFSGKEGRYNPEGKRTFCIVLDPETASGLEKDGWNISWLEPRDPEDDKKPILRAEVSYRNIPPKVVLVTSHGKTILDEETIGSLDWAEIENVDIVISPYHWTYGSKSGVKAYVKSMYVTIREDPFEDKYFHTPDTALKSTVGCANCDACDGSCGCCNGD